MQKTESAMAVIPVLRNLEALQRYLQPERNLFEIRPGQRLHHSSIKSEGALVTTVGSTRNSFDVSIFPLHSPALRKLLRGRISPARYIEHTRKKQPILVVGAVPQTELPTRDIHNSPAVESACLYVTIPVNLEHLPRWQQSERGRMMAKVATSARPSESRLGTREMKLLRAIGQDARISQIYFELLANPTDPTQQEWQLCREYANGATMSVSLEDPEFADVREVLNTTTVATLESLGDPLAHLTSYAKAPDYFVEMLRNPVFMPTTS